MVSCNGGRGQCRSRSGQRVSERPCRVSRGQLQCVFGF